MKSTIEPVEGNKVKLSVTVDEAEFEPAIDQAWKSIAREVRIPGFRPGKVPRKVLESRVEPGYARAEAMNHSLPEFYLDAVLEHDVDVIAQPSIDVTSGEDEGPISFDATVEVRPEITVAGYANLTLVIPSPHPTDDVIGEQITRFLNQYSELAEVERPAATGDVITIDIEGQQDGEAVDGLCADDYSYEVGSASIVPELDDQVRGLKAGDSVSFDAPHPQEDEPEIHFEISIKAVQEKVLPELTDEWVAEATDFESVADFRDDIVGRLTESHRARASTAVQNEIGEKLAELVAEDIPEVLVGAEMRSRIEGLVGRLSEQGISLEQYLQFTGTEAETFTADLRRDAETASKVDLALRSIVRLESLTPSDDDVDAEIAHVAMHMEVDPATAREQLESGGQISAIRSDLGRRNALRWLIENAEINDESGQPVNRDDLALFDDEHDHDQHDDDDEHEHEHDDERTDA